MDKVIQILLGSQKNINSVNVNTYDKVQLFNRESEIMEYNVNDTLSASEVFDVERESNSNYRVYGKLEYLSLLNGLKNNYKTFEDYMTPQYGGNSKNIVNSFDFYLVCAATTGYTKIIGTTTDSDKYIRYFKVIATPKDFEIFPAGFSNNVYGEQAHAFCFRKDFDVSMYFDELKFPATELFIYAQYIRKINGNDVSEMMYGTTWSTVDCTPSKFDYPTTGLVIGDYVKAATGVKIGDVIEHFPKEFIQNQIIEQTVYINTQYRRNNESKKLIWKFNPFMPLRLRYFENQLNTANTGSTSYDILASIPNYATPIDNNGNLVWRDIMLQGYNDPLTGVGVNYPFVNKCRYLFANLILSIVPDLTDVETKDAFNTIWFSHNISDVNSVLRTNNDLNKIGKPCQG